MRIERSEIPLSSLTLLSVRRVHGRAVLSLSSGETRVMPRALLKERPYRGGTPFDEAAFETLLRERAYPFALEKAVSLLAVRARTEKELRDALHQCAYPEETIDRVMARMQEAGYLNDADFAAHWAASRTGKGMGTRRIGMELRRKGVSSETIGQTLDAIDEDELLEGALKTARKAAKGRDLSLPAERQKVSAALIRRGYGYDHARKALSQLLEEQVPAE